MKLKGESFDTPEPVDIFVSSGAKVVHLRANAVLDYDPFLELCPEPKAREILKPGGKRSLDMNDPEYLKQLDEYGSKRTAWMILTSLDATEGLEWDTVDPGDPETWGNVEKELSQAFTPFGLARIVNGVLQANGLDETVLEQARESFLA